MNYNATDPASYKAHSFEHYSTKMRHIKLDESFVRAAVFLQLPTNAFIHADAAEKMTPAEKMQQNTIQNLSHGGKETRLSSIHQEIAGRKARDSSSIINVVDFPGIINTQSDPSQVTWCFPPFLLIYFDASLNMNL